MLQPASIGLGDDAVAGRSLGRRVIHAKRDTQDVKCIRLEHDGLRRRP